MQKKKIRIKKVWKQTYLFLEKCHDENTKHLNKAGSLNPVYGKTYRDKDKDLIRSKKVKYVSGVGIYGSRSSLIKSFSHASDLAKYLNVSEVKLSKYINKGLLYKKHYLKVNAWHK